MSICVVCGGVGGHRINCNRIRGDEDTSVVPKHDPVNHPSHYTAYQGLEIIDLTEQLNFNRGNAVKYISRAGLKPSVIELEDLKKARWYIDREIKRIGGEDG